MDSAAGQAAEALARLRAARDMRDALAPLHRILQDVDEEVRAAAVSAANANLSQHTIADQLDVAQPTVKSWLDGRARTPLPAPSVAQRMWILHLVTQAVSSILARLQGECMPTGAPSSYHVEIRPTLRRATESVNEGAAALSRVVAALEYAERMASER